MPARGRPTGSSGSSPASSRNTAPPAKRRRTTARRGRTSKPSARYQRILEDEMYEDHIQRMYSPATASDIISTRDLRLEVQRQRDGPAFTLPTLQSMCLELTATHFLTHVLPSREAFDQVQRGRGISNGNRRSEPQSRPQRGHKASRIVSRGIGGRPILDEETAAGDDYVPSDGEEEGLRDERVGIAAAASHSRRSSSRPRPAPTTNTVTSTEELQEMAQEHSHFLKLLPPMTKLKLLRLLRTRCPQALTRQVIVTYFVHGLPEVELDSAMQLFAQHPQEINLVLRSIGPPSTTPSPSLSTVPLRRLSLSGLTRASPEAIASLFLRCHHLEEVVLKGCPRVDAQCITALLKHNARHLCVLNANFTDVGPEGTEAVISQAPNLQVLKIADVVGLADKVFPDAIMRASKVGQAAEPPYVPLAHLRSLKIRNTQMGDASLTALFGLLTKAEAPLTRLDVGSIDLTGHRADSLIKWLGCPSPVVVSPVDPPAHKLLNLRKMEKLNLSNTSAKYATDSERLHSLITYATLVTERLILDGIIFAAMQPRSGRHRLPSRTLIDSLIDGSLRLAGADMRMPRRLSLAGTDIHLQRSDFLVGPSLDTGSVSGGMSGPYSESESETIHIGSEWGPLVAHAEEVNLSGVDLSSLSLNIGDELQATCWNIKDLHLGDTRINDDGLAAFAAKCDKLERISLANTAITSEGVRNLVTKCPYLTSIDLTGCRGIPVRERRNVFEFLS